MASKTKTKIYFWLKLDNNFYKNLAIKKARRLAGGDTLVIIYQKLMLESLQNEGVLYFEGVLENVVEELSLQLDEDVENVAMTLDFFAKSGLIQVNDNNDVEMLQVPALIDQETNWGKYKREARKQGSTKKLDIVQPLSNHCPTEIELEKEEEKEKEKEKEKDIVEENFIFPDYLSEKAVDQIKKGNPKNYKLRFPIAYLNQVTEKNFQFVEKNTKLINSRLLEGYKLEDFKTVVDIKFDEWKGTEMAKYIRPETLFGTKFDGYLNQIPVNQTNKNYVDDGLDLPF